MNKQNTKYLYKTFPWYHPEKTLQESLMSFGFMCGDGWFKLIKKLSEDIEKEFKKNPNLLIAGDEKNKVIFQIDEVKEKFGGLRFYTNFIPNNKINKLISNAEKYSYTVCEYCGKKGHYRGDLPWVTTLCDKCYKLEKVRKLKWSK